MAAYTDQKLKCNRADVTLLVMEKKKIFTDIAVPADHNITETQKEVERCQKRES